MQAFGSLAKRATVRKAVQQHELELLLLLEAENTAVARALEQIRRDPVGALQGARAVKLPRFSGAALAATCLIRRTTATWTCLQVPYSAQRPLIFPSLFSIFALDHSTPT